jgi:hypothetical protein
MSMGDLCLVHADYSSISTWMAVIAVCNAMTVLWSNNTGTATSPCRATVCPTVCVHTSSFFRYLKPLLFSAVSLTCQQIIFALVLIIIVLHLNLIKVCCK